jgi:anti-sigma factor RsiW
MNCTQARAHLAALVYGDLPPAQTAAVEKHLAGCAACTRERHELQAVRRLLDAAPAPAVQVDMRRLYRQANARQQRSTRRWRRAAVALLGVAVLALIVFGLRLEVCWEAHQVTLRWGTPEVVPLPASTVAEVSPREGTRKPPTAEDVQLLRELIHALAADGEARDQRQYLYLQRLQGRLDALQLDSAQRWQALERDIAALYASQFGKLAKGETK